MFMQITAYAHTSQGGRPVNEDTVKVWAGEKQGIFVVADGLGGHHKGDTASRMAAEVILGGLRQEMGPDGPSQETMGNVFQQANHTVLEGQKEEGHKDMMTTAVALAIGHGKASWGYVGDSRLYHFSNGSLISVTKDHSLSFKKYLFGEISWEDIREDQDRSALLRAIGGEQRCLPGLAGPVEISEGDAFLLCSDGFWEYLSTDEIKDSLFEAPSPEAWAKTMLALWESRGNPNRDNASLITVFA